MQTRPLAAALITLASAGTVAHAQWTAVVLEQTGATRSEAYGAGGSQQVGRIISFDTQLGLETNRASLWIVPGTRTDLHTFGISGESYALASNGAQQVGRGGMPGAIHACLWSGFAESVVDLNPAGATDSEASAISGDFQGGRAAVNGADRASLWNGTAESWVDLHPPGADSSWVRGMSGPRQAGYAIFGFPTPFERASLWTGTAASWVNLNPAGASGSRAFGIDGKHQVGYAIANFAQRASLWSGTPDSWVDLHPAGMTSSIAFAVSGSEQAGIVVFAGESHAVVWNGTADSMIPLHGFLPAGFVSSEARGISTDGTNTYVSGFARNGTTGKTVAVLWTRPCVAPFVPDSPPPVAVCAGGSASLSVTPVGTGPFTYQWFRAPATIVPGETISVLTITNASAADAGAYYCVVTNACGSVSSDPATFTICFADLNCDDGVDINDLLYFLSSFEAGSFAADLDNGTSTGTPDNAVDINDLLFFLARFEAGC